MAKDINGGGARAGATGAAAKTADEEAPTSSSSAAAAGVSGAAAPAAAGLLARLRRGAACWWWALDDPALWRRPNDQKKTLPPQWALIHSPWRFLHALVPYLGPPTRSLAHIWAPLATVMALCVAIEFAEGRTAWALDKYNNYARLYRLSSFVLSLLLAFRANRTYDRWWLARSAFGGIGGGLVNLVRLVATLRPDDPVLIRQCQKWSLCMVYGMLQLIRERPDVVDPRVEALLDADELALYRSTTKPSKLASTMLSALLHGAGFEVEREVQFEQALGGVAANVSMVARLKLQAMPYAMSLFCTGYTYIWLLLLPFGVFPEASWSALVPVFIMATMMLGLEDLTNQLEDPFKFIPYEAMAATTAKDMPRTVREVRACQELMREKYAPLRAAGAAGAAAMTPWPPPAALGPQPMAHF